MSQNNSIHRTSQKGLSGVLSRYPLISFFVIAYACSWVIEIPLALCESGVFSIVLPRPVVAIAIVVGTLGPAISAFIMTGIVGGKTGVTDLLRRYVQWRAGIQWYLFILVGIPIIILLGTIVLPEAIASFNPVLFTLLGAYPLAFFMTFFLGGPFGEEPGWRGFALPRLQKHQGPLIGSLILGVLWALWHLPLFWSGVWTPPTVANIAMFIVMITALTVIMTWVFNHVNGSILIMMLTHASFNTFANKIAAPLFPAPILNEYGLLPVLIGFAATALVLIVATKGRLGYNAYQPRETL